MVSNVPRRIETTEQPYIVRDSHILNGEPIIRDTRVPVRSIVESHRRGLSPEEIVEGHPHLTLAQVYAALSYYADHQEEITRFIEANRVEGSLFWRSQQP